MKRNIAILLIVFVAAFFSSCDDIKKTVSIDSNQTMENKSQITFDMLTAPVVIEKGLYFTIYKTSSQDINRQYYWYQIFDRYNSVVFDGGTQWKKPEISVADYIVNVKCSMGTLDNRYVYCNVNTGDISSVFFNVLAQNDELICLFDVESRSLVILNVFDDLTNIAKIKKDFDFRAEPVIDAKFISDSAVEYSYYSSDGVLKNDILKF